jgi:hypothetical protein
MKRILLAAILALASFATHAHDCHMPCNTLTD